MEQELVQTDNERDDKVLKNLTGAELYYFGMNLPRDNWITVKYDTLKKAHIAVSGCGNKCRYEGTTGLFTVQRWVDHWGVSNVTVTKTPKCSSVKLQKMYADMQSFVQNKELQLLRTEENAAGFNEVAYLGMSVDENAAISMREDAILHLQNGVSDEIILDLGITKDVLVWAKEQIKELAKPKYAAIVLPGADDDWDKTTWTEAQVRGHQIFGWIVLSCEKGKDVITIAEEGRLKLSIVQAIYAEVTEAAAAKVKATRKAVIADDKKRNPEKYQTKVKGEDSENAEC